MAQSQGDTDSIRGLPRWCVRGLVDSRAWSISAAAMPHAATAYSGRMHGAGSATEQNAVDAVAAGIPVASGRVRPCCRVHS